uniref:Uncharacterized protein n=1 Tax=Coccidioides posadasii RMSCC 3488 TaxID=454284 RepID=A0A0J6F7U7_COCPO|nr:hypothetical protein CPAG_01721 [Coccidioides posadasii RMSCC 3488]
MFSPAPHVPPSSMKALTLAVPQSSYPGEDEDDSDDSNNDTFDDEGQLPPEHYLAQAKSLNVSQL